jgi:light-regulated signal transduction histidine kinase (bacteriophytochrome)
VTALVLLRHASLGAFLATAVLAAAAVLGRHAGVVRRSEHQQARDAEALIASDRRRAEAVHEQEAANRRYDSVVEDLRQFAHVVGHDLGEPLRTMKGFARLVAAKYPDRPLDEVGRRYLTHVVDGADRMQQLITDLRSYSEAGHSLLRDDPVDLAAVVASVEVALADTIATRGARIRIAGPLPRVRGDRLLLQVVLQHLIDNAIKFNRAAVPLVTICGAATADGQAILQVQDNGIGIRPDQFDRIFVLFQRLHTPDEYPGTGLGLAISSRIVSRHGGRLSVDSTPGRGSTFTITLPAHDGFTPGGDAAEVDRP